MIKKTLLLRSALFFAVLLVSYLVFSKPQYPQTITDIDKIGHIGSFFLLSLLSYLAFTPRWYWIVLPAVFYGLLIEVIQSFIPYRSGDYQDFVADMLGVLLFYLLLFFGRFIYKYWQARRS